MRPWEEGWEAGLAGRDPRVCPYRAMTWEWQIWQTFHGWAVDLLR